MLLVLSCAWLAVVAWLIGRAFAQRGLLQRLDAAQPPPLERAASVAVIVPARDEEANIARCLRSVLHQTYPQSQLRIVLIDDDSSDRTAAIARSIAEQDSRLAVLRSPPLPPRWIGKSHACWIGTRAVAPETEWLCFIDADVWAEPELMSSAINAAGRDRLDLLSLAPRQELGSFAERLVMPCGLYLLAFCQDLREVQSPAGDDATATGQFMLVRRAAYEAVGGHAALYGAIAEDLMLARLLKRSGYHVLLHDGGQLLTTRMYTGWSSLWIGISKNLVDMLAGSLRTIAIAGAAVVLAWVAWLVPGFAAWQCTQGAAGACLALVPGAIGSAAMFGLHIAGAAYFRIPWWYGLLCPLGYTVGAAMALDSVRRRFAGRVSWKGRTYP